MSNDNLIEILRDHWLTLGVLAFFAPLYWALFKGAWEWVREFVGWLK